MSDRILTFLDEQEREQFGLLQELVLESSSSYYKSGVDRVGTLISHQLEGCGMSVEVVKESQVGDQLIYRSPACNYSSKSILLVGHMDTVFPVDSKFNWYQEEGDRILGPGVIDMKGGLVTAVFALKALSHCGLLDTIPITMICNSDEEIGSPYSRPLIFSEAEKSFFAMVFECGGLNGELVTGRKGKAGYLLNVQGKAGHAAFAGPDKASAILELAHKTIALEELNDPSKEIVVNVGVIEGGIGPNSVAETATAEIDTRFLRESDAKITAKNIERIAAKCHVLGTSATLSATSTRLPMEQSAGNKELFHMVEAQAQGLGLSVVEELRSGVSDANIIADTHVPVIDGMGPVGDCDHSDREYMVKDSLPAKSKLAALSLVKGWESYSS